MKDMFKVRAISWFVMGLLLLISIIPVRHVQAFDLTDEEAYWLTYMREEEKLARDIYLFLYDRWHSRIFDNISAAEQKHMDAVKTVLDRYGVQDPSVGKRPGQFANPVLQALYGELTGQGAVSLVDALEVGVLVEESDIDDLAAANASTTRTDIKTVYGNLLKGSLSHLKAFVSNLSRHGVISE